MNNKNIPWIMIGVLTVALFLVARTKPIGKILPQSRPFSQRPFIDDWNTPTAPGNTPIGPIVPIGNPTTYAEALAMSKQNNKPVLLFFTGKSCQPCQRMKNELASSIPSLNGQVYWLEVDAHSNLDLCKKYNVVETPTYLIINSQEQVMKTGSGYKDVRGFSEWLAAPYQNLPPTSPPATPPGTEPQEQPKRRLLRPRDPGPSNPG